MRAGAVSLRSRLLVLMLIPLLLVTAALGTWRVVETNRLAADLFDRTLLSTALAIARDVTIHDGDALSADTLGLLTETSGGQIFYHVRGPDGSFITGYATPPVGGVAEYPRLKAVTDEQPTIFSGVYRGAPVRVVQIRDNVNMGWVSGEVVVSVWQELGARRTFASVILTQTIIVQALLLLTVGVLSWFGLRFALRPLTDLEDAIERRHGDDLTPIRRAVPMEVRGIVATLNQLLDRVSRRISSKDQFISNAAHQLRNPIAGVVSLAQTLRGQDTAGPGDERIEALVTASQHLSRLSNQLLSFERTRDLGALPDDAGIHDLNDLAAEVIERSAPDLLRQGHGMTFEKGPPMPVRCVPILIQEVLQNLLDNAAKHGKRADLSIIVSLVAEPHGNVLRVTDDGVGLSPEDQTRAFARFSQIEPGSGSGLGLSIADMICRRHGGRLVIEDVAKGTSIAAIFPPAA